MSSYNLLQNIFYVEDVYILDLHDDTLFSVTVACPDLTISANGGVVYSDTTIPRAEGSMATYISGVGRNFSMGALYSVLNGEKCAYLRSAA